MSLETDSEYYGFLFESIIGAHLSFIPNTKLYYWREGNFEVDYVIEKEKNITAIEIKSGFKKSGAGLKEFSKCYPKAQCELWDYNDCISFLTDKKIWNTKWY